MLARTVLLLLLGNSQWRKATSLISHQLTTTSYSEANIYKDLDCWEIVTISSFVAVIQIWSTGRNINFICQLHSHYCQKWNSSKHLQFRMYRLLKMSNRSSFASLKHLIQGKCTNYNANLNVMSTEWELQYIPAYFRSSGFINESMKFVDVKTNGGIFFFLPNWVEFFSRNIVSLLIHFVIMFSGFLVLYLDLVTKEFY